ncbi:GNAT family N-acetyltransferase [Mesobacillus maritimus]|uniref:GNAT family N-acetyltransferase n=1 Tax=Mesobacillus maritimus TaxID=1643336 RepID=UPI00384F1218
MIKDLYTSRLHLKKMSVTDAPKLFKIWSDPDVTKFMNISPFTHEKQAKEMIEFLDQLAQEQKAIRFSIFHQDTNELIGSCGFNTLDFENNKTEIGYDIAKVYWGNGYASEAIAALIKTAFDTLNMNRVEAKVEQGNINSIRVLQKLNFTFEGTLKQSEESKGKFVDLHLYSKLKSS